MNSLNKQQTHVDNRFSINLEGKNRKVRKRGTRAWQIPLFEGVNANHIRPVAQKTLKKKLKPLTTYQKHRHNDTIDLISKQNEFNEIVTEETDNLRTQFSSKETQGKFYNHKTFVQKCSLCHRRCSQ